MDLLDLKQQPHYLPLLARWHHDEWQHLNPGQSLHDRIRKMQAYLSEDFIPSTFIALGGELLGSAAIVECDMDTRPYLSPWLASVYIAPPYRGAGVGMALVKHVMSAAAEERIKRIYLFTESHVNYYRSLGWEIHEDCQYQGHDVTIMSVGLDCMTRKVGSDKSPALAKTT